MVKDYSNSGPGQELETFLPQDSTNGAVKYKIQPAKKPDVETNEYDPFAARVNEHPTTDNETMTHLLKAALGTGILAMPIAFLNAGLGVGVIATLATAFVCTHCCFILVGCAHHLSRKTRVPQMTFSEIATVSCANGPNWAKKCGQPLKWIILASLFVTYFGTCSVYSVIVATNLNQVIDHFMGTNINIRLTLVVLLVPLILLVFTPNLKYLAPISFIANIFMGCGLGITIYYLVTDLPPITDRPLTAELKLLPVTLSIVIFAMEAIGVVMPLENQMKTPQNFLGGCGVLNRGMGAITVIYIILGFLGYWKYGDATEGSITLNLPSEQVPAQAVKVFIALGVFCTYGLQFFVCLEILWNPVKDYFTKRPTVVNYVLRTVLAAATIGLAVAVPTIAPFMGLIGAFSFSIVGLLVPVFIEMVTYWEDGFGFCWWRIWKNVIVIIFACTALIFGSKMAIADIIKEYQ